MLLHQLVVLGLVVSCVVVTPRAGISQNSEWTLDDVLARAKEHAPEAVAARARRTEAPARMARAATLLRENPEIEGGMGGRATPDGTLLESEIGITQFFETGGQRRARISGARAHADKIAAQADGAVVTVAQRAASLFFSILHGEESARLSAKEAQIAGDMAQATARRVRAGDLAALDGNLAQAAAARTRATAVTRDAELASLRGALRALLGLEANAAMALRGTLRERRTYVLDELLAQVPSRARLRVLDAAAAEAQAEADVGRATAWPDVGLGARYERDDGNNVGFGTVTIRVPVFERGQEQRLAGAARANRLRATAASTRQTMEVEVRTAFEVQQLSGDAVSAFERDALPPLDENEQLAERGFAAGELRLIDVLAIRREILQTRQEYLDRLLAAALAGVELEARAGVLR